MSIRKKPWNRVNLPVYSVVSRGEKGFNMHICTYVSSVSMDPKRYMVALFEGTLTRANVEAGGEFVLQLLAEKQFNLVTLLGKLSGKRIDKMERLEKRSLIAAWKDFPVLKEALAYLHLKVISSVDGGDHKCYICEVLSYQNKNEGKPLELEFLRSKGIIRG